MDRMTDEQTGTSESTFYVTVEQLPLSLTDDHLRLVAEANKEKEGFHKTAYCMASDLLASRAELERLRARVGELEEEVLQSQAFIDGCESIIEKFKDRMDGINNIAVGWKEGGPYEDTDAEVMSKMHEIEELSLLPPRISFWEAEINRLAAAITELTAQVKVAREVARDIIKWWDDGDDYEHCKSRSVGVFDKLRAIAGEV